MDERIEQIRVESLIPYARNARTHNDAQVAQIAASIREFGFCNPVLVDEAGGIIAGHGRVLAARKLGMQEVPCRRLSHLTETQKRAYVLADNKLALNAGWDDELLRLELEELQAQEIDITMLGFDEGELSRLKKSIKRDASGGSGPGEDEAEELREKWKTALGQVWALGNHVIACGDSTRPEIFSAIMGQALAQMTHTDPPYGVSYRDRQERFSEKREIKNDGLANNDLSALVAGALTLCSHHSVDSAAFYVWHATSTRRDFEHALDLAGLEEKQYLTWVKDSMVLGRSHYHWQTEPCFYCQKAGFSAAWFGDRTNTTAWRISTGAGSGAYAMGPGLHISDGDKNNLILKGSKPKSQKLRHVRIAAGESILVVSVSGADAWEISRENRMEYMHPNQKPVELAERAILNSSQAGDIVLEPFSGSASTLLACEQTGRKCRAIELDPKYVAVALQRWADATGGTPELIDG